MREKERLTLEQIDQQLKNYMVSMSKIDSKIRDLRKLRVRHQDKYDYFRYLRVKLYGRDVLSMGIGTVGGDSGADIRDAGVNVTDAVEFTEEAEGLEPETSDYLDDSETDDEDDAF